MWGKHSNTALEERIDHLERAYKADISDLQTEFKKLRLETDGWYEKFRSMFMNQARRYKREQEEMGEGEGTSTGALTEGNGQPDDIEQKIPGFRNMDPMSQRIYLRRAGYFRSPSNQLVRTTPIIISKKDEQE